MGDAVLHAATGPEIIMLAEALEQIQSSPSRRAIHVRIILAALAAIVAVKTLWFARVGPWHFRGLADFDAFHIVAQRVWLGDVGEVYRLATFAKMQADAAGGTTGVMPWTYPPQFDLLLAPLALLPVGAAYLSFTTVTLALYLLTLRAIARENFAQVLIISFPALAVTIGCGQNGFLTGALIGLFCLALQKRPVLAGLALGAMVIKPHLAVAAGVYLVMTRRFAAIAVAAMVVLASSLVSTLIFGPQIWSALMASVRESAGYLDQGVYQLFRMISAYAALHTAGMPATAAISGQIAVAALALLAVVLGALRGPSPGFALGVTAMASVMISPYAYDYDLPILAIGLALALPDLVHIASARERSAMYGLILLAGAYGLVLSTLASGQQAAPAMAGFASMVVLALLLRWLLRDEAAVHDGSMGHLPRNALHVPD
ncbi:glycosyltransferase family 87 protein [Bradyrhizobium sp. CB82]|uniref:glycosyltransferase family 87 protein n=1 Tax=Bradyrhizobium sp. CB82 TaxID=3039159 RepID=UPI0024B0BF6B|nr:glycosyltransferase family 87 protein [Bradyrhizobium sp. CB82]WFU42254.1 glycosyltransferase family 87 protein [Bradyrhizobium sp. CB82]